MLPEFRAYDKVGFNVPENFVSGVRYDLLQSSCLCDVRAVTIVQ